MAAFLSPFSALFFSLILLTDEKAVSVDEKNAENKNHYIRHCGTIVMGWVKNKTVDKVIDNIKLGMEREVQRCLGKDDAEVDKPLLDFVRTWKV